MSSKLNQKIKALIGLLNPEHLLAGTFDARIADILADVQELEQAKLWRKAALQELERGAKREAYEHALALWHLSETGAEMNEWLHEAIGALAAEERENK